jgi:hypothetical protein
MPKMMLGIAASSSIAVPIGRRNQTGASSVSTMTMPRLIGTPKRRAINEVTSVPKTGATAPNFSVTGFHEVLVKKPKPSFAKAGQLPMARESRMPARMRRTKAAKE